VDIIIFLKKIGYLLEDGNEGSGCRPCISVSQRRCDIA